MNQGAVKALWCVPGIGRAAIERIGRCVDGSRLLEVSPSQWCNDASVGLRPELKRRLTALPPLGEVLSRLEKVLNRGGQRCVLRGEPGYPTLLEPLADAPLLLFLKGPGAQSPRRRVAVVGSRRPDREVLRPTYLLAQALAERGVGVVSGLAEGVDQSAHAGALAGQGETWAFVACGLDQLDSIQQKPAEQIIDGGGTVLSCFPPGVRTQPSAFARRNKFIAGSAEAVWLVRAAAGSGGLLTARAAKAYGRPLLVSPGDWWNPTAQATLELLRSREAGLCLSVEDLLSAVGLSGALRQLTANEKASEPPTDPLVVRVLAALEAVPLDFDLVCARLKDVTSGQVSSALTQLELMGWVLQKPGRRFERVAR